MVGEKKSLARSWLVINESEDAQMAIDFALPQLAEGVESADIAEIHVKEGDTLTAGQIVMELETDKAVMELPCPHAGTVAKVLVKPGQTVKVGQPVLSVEPSGAGSPALNGGAAPSKPAASNGNAGKDAPAPSASVARATAAAPAPASTGTATSTRGFPAGPATRRLARELGLALDRVTGSGPGGRITLEDVARAASGTGGSGGGGIAVPPLPDFAKFGTVERVGYTKLQKTVVNNLSLAWQVIPHVTQHDLADITDTEAARKRFQEAAGKSGVKVTMTAVAIKAVVACLKAFPNFNSSYDSAKSELVLKKYYNIGIAVDTPTGLVVPVIRDADQKTILQLAAEMNEVAERARAGKLTLNDMTGGTFTITNLGGIGGTAFTPIVNYPEVAILGMSRSQQQLQMIDGQIVPRLMLPLSLSYDHRVVNGADAARFMVKLSGLFSDAFKLLVEA